MCSFTQQHEQQVMEGRMGSLEQAVQALTARMTEVFEMLSARDRRDAVENGRRRLRAGEGEEFLAYKEEASKRMEEIRKRMESFSPPRTSPTSQSLPITGESNASSVGTNFMPHIINIKPTEDVTMSPEFFGDISSPDGRVVKEGVAGILVAASPEGAENIMGVLQQNVKKKEEERKHGLEEHEVIFTKTELKQNEKKEDQGLIFAKPEFFLGDKEDVRGEG
jgi:hypothetical protein